MSDEVVQVEFLADAGVDAVVRLSGHRLRYGVRTVEVGGRPRVVELRVDSAGDVGLSGADLVRVAGLLDRLAFAVGRPVDPGSEWFGEPEKPGRWPDYLPGRSGYRMTFAGPVGPDEQPEYAPPTAPDSSEGEGYVYKAPETHRCVPGGFMDERGLLTLGNPGDVWRCRCGQHWRLDEVRPSWWRRLNQVVAGVDPCPRDLRRWTRCGAPGRSNQSPGV